MFRVEVLLAGAVLLGVAIASPGLAQEDATDRDDEKPTKHAKSDVARAVGQLAHDARAFRARVNRDLDPKDLEDVRDEDRLEHPLKEVDKAIDRLRTRLDGADTWSTTLPDAYEVVRESSAVNALFGRVYAYTPLRPRWLALRKKINALAGMYKLYPLPMPAKPPEPLKP